MKCDGIIYSNYIVAKNDFTAGKLNRHFKFRGLANKRRFFMDSDTLSTTFIAGFHFKMCRKLDRVNVICNNINRLVNTNAIPEFHSVAV